MGAKFIQLQPWHDQLLGLTDQGEVYRIIVDRNSLTGEFYMTVDAVPLITAAPGVPHGHGNYVLGAD